MNVYPTTLLAASGETGTHLIAAADLDAAVVHAERLHGREQVLHRAHPRAAAPAPQRGAERGLWLGIPHLRRHPRLLHDEVPPLAGARREQRGGGARARVEPHARPAHRRRERLLRPARLVGVGKGLVKQPVSAPGFRDGLLRWLPLTGFQEKAARATDLRPRAAAAADIAAAAPEERGITL